MGYHLHISVGFGHDEVQSLELVGELNNALLLIGEDHALTDLDALVNLDEGIELPFLLGNGHVELLDTVEGQLFILD